MAKLGPGSEWGELQDPDPHWNWCVANNPHGIQLGSIYIYTRHRRPWHFPLRYTDQAPTWPRWSCIGTVGTGHTLGASAGMAAYQTGGVLDCARYRTRRSCHTFTVSSVLYWRLHPFFQFREMCILCKLLHFQENHQVLYVVARIIHFFGKIANYFARPRAFAPVLDIYSWKLLWEQIFSQKISQICKNHMSSKNVFFLQKIVPFVSHVADKFWLFQRNLWKSQLWKFSLKNFRLHSAMAGMRMGVRIGTDIGIIFFSCSPIRSRYGTAFLWPQVYS
jgi:hypothetical protein